MRCSDLSNLGDCERNAALLSGALAAESSATVIHLDDLPNDIELAHPDKEAEKLEIGDDEV